VKYSKYIIAVIAAFTLGACVGMPETPTSMHVTAVSSGNTFPTALYFFALESDEKFRRMDYSELMQARASKLGGEILVQSKSILVPGGKVSKTLRLPPNTRYFGVVAGFSSLDGSDNWKYLKAVDNGRNSLILHIGNNSIR